MKIPVFILILLLFLVVNVYVYRRIWIAMPPKKTMRVSFFIVVFFTLFSFILASLIGEFLPIPITSFLYTIGSSWMLISIYFVLAFLFQDIVLLVNKVFNFVPARIVTGFSKANWTEMLFVMGFITLLIIGGCLKYQAKNRVYLPIQFSKMMGDSISPKSYRIVAVSDLHLGYTIGPKELDRWVSLINKEKPDAVLIAGDLVDNSYRPLHERNYSEILRKIEAPLGVYACLGNHEYIATKNISEHTNFFKESNINLLRDNYALVDSAFYVVGRDDRSNSERRALSDLVDKLDKSKPVILLDHQPYDLSVTADNKIDLQISGHTHQGQVWPISMITGWIYELQHGYRQTDSTHYYVTSGLGIWGGKFRIGTSSEYVVIDINKDVE